MEREREEKKHEKVKNCIIGGGDIREIEELESKKQIIS